MELTLSAYEVDPHRLVRLVRVAAALGHVRHMSRLHDHKGTLEVTWRTEPEPEQRRLVELVWAEIGCEPNVEHVVEGLTHA
jgi:hypothetical protein